MIRSAEPGEDWFWCYPDELMFRLRGLKLGVVRGSALYIGALIGPGLLLVPALAVQAAGGASIVAWAALIVLSAPLAITFAALGIRHPVAGGVSAYVRAGRRRDARRRSPAAGSSPPSSSARRPSR